MKFVDVAVVGAGPAGTAAALAASSAGAKTVLIDEQPQTGGTLRWSIARIGDLPGNSGDIGGVPGIQLADALRDRLQRSNVETLLRTTAWGWFDENVLGVMAQDKPYQMKANSIVIASGSTDIVMPFSGSTLPGVMTARAVLIFLHVHRVLPGRRFAVLGDGRDADEVIEAIEIAGAEVVCRAKNVAEISASGSDHVQEIHLADCSYGVEAVVLALGRQPDPGLALQSLAQNAYSAAAGGIVPRRGPSCETSTQGVYVVGDAAGMIGTAEAMAEGHLAGLAAADADASLIDDARRELTALRDSERSKAVDSLRLVTAVR